MKKIFYLLVAGLMILGLTEAGAQQVSFGIKGGYNSATWEGDAMQNLDNLVSLTNGVATASPRRGFHAGVYTRIALGNTFSIEPGVNYSQKGMALSGEFASENFEFLNLKGTITNQADYIEVPLLAKVFVTEGLHFFGGPQVSFLVSNKINARASVLGFNVVNRDFNYDKAFRKTDVGLLGGVGYKFGNGLNLSAGYDYGLNTVDKNGSFDTFNRVVKASVGFEF